ncbi:angiopoietin-related protein 7-like isoform X1 [Lineus longissimus]|uniref:angiopoietin-related protein 7-like isoform X1 n=1 Tax=Lineus longissimus TaxID=88925 RepID=UPI00315DDD11
MKSGFFLTLFSCLIIIHGSTTAPSEVTKEPQKGDTDIIEDEKRQAAVHQYRSVCHGDGTCSYIFTLTVPATLGMPLPLDVDSMMGSIDADSPKVKVIQEQLQVLHNTLYNLTMANHEETMMLTNDINNMQTNVKDIDTKVKDVDSHTRMLNDGYSTLKNDVSQIEAKVAAATQSLDTKLSKAKAEMVQVEGELKSMEEYFAMYKDGVSEHDLQNFQYVIKVQQPEPAENLAVGTDCSVLYNAGMNISGVYAIKPDPGVNGTTFDVYCDMETDGGGWTVLQRREDGMQNFDRKWADYKDGFGDLTGEYWLGLEKMYILNLRGNNAVRFDLWDFAGETAHASYTKFILFGEDDKYRIQVGQYSGDAGNAFHYGNRFLRHNNQQFSTIDNDNDRYGRSCPEIYSSGWWFHNCMVANLNGLYYEGGVYKSHRKDGIMWQPWRHESSLKKTEIKVRPANFLKNQQKVIDAQNVEP